MISTRAQDLIQKFVDRMMSPEERAELDRLLVDDPEVAEAFAEATRLASFLEHSLGELSGRAEAAGPRKRTARRKVRAGTGSGGAARFLIAASVLFGVFVVLLMASLSEERRPVARRSGEPRREPRPRVVERETAPPPGRKRDSEVAKAKPVERIRPRVRPRSQPSPSPLEAKPSPRPVPETLPPARPAPVKVPKEIRPVSPPSPKPAPPTAVAVAVVKSVEGVVGLAGGGKAGPAGAGDSLREGHRLETHGTESRAVIAFQDGTEVELGPDTEVAVPEQETGKRILLVQGRIRSRISRQPRNRPMVFETPHARAVVLGTTLRLGVEEGTTSFTRLGVTEGKVRLVRTRDSKSVEVPAGHYTLTAESRPAELRAFPFVRPLGAAAHGKVRAVAFSPDGASVASAGGDGAIKLWSASKVVEIASLASHARDATSVDFSARGGLLASGSFDDTARIWVARTRRSAARITTIVSSYEAVRFSPNGRLLATATSDGVVRLWESPSGKFVDMFPGHPGGAETLAFSPDGKLLASGGRDRAARLWDLGTREERRSLEGHAGRVNAVVFLADGRRLASGSGDGTIRFWDVATGRSESVLRVPGGSGVLSLALSSDGRRLASADADGRVRLWDVALGCVAETLAAHPGQVVDVAFSQDGRLMASAGTDDRIRVWRVK